MTTGRAGWALFSAEEAFLPQDHLHHLRLPVHLFTVGKPVMC